MGKPRLSLGLRADLSRKLEEATRRPGVTKNAIIEQALEEYFEPRIRHDLEERLLARLDRFEVRQDEIERDVALLLETLGQFVLYWLTRTDPIPEGEREIAHALGQRQFGFFIGKRCQNGRPNKLDDDQFTATNDGVREAGRRYCREVRPG